MTKNNQNSNQSGSKFLLSFVMLVGALGLTFGVMFFYSPKKKAPTDEIRSASELAENLNKGAKTRKLGEAGKREHTRPYSIEDPSHGTQANNAARAEGKPTSSGSGSDDASHDVNHKDFEEKLSEAMKLVDSGNPIEAKKILEDIIRTDPKNEQALVELGMIYLIDLKDSGQALGQLESALKVNPNNRVVLSEVLGIYDEQGRGEAGVNFLQGLYDENPDNATVASGIGQLLASQDRLHDAVPYLETAANKAMEEKTNEGAITDLADVYSELGEHQKALETYRQVPELEKEKIANGSYDGQPGMAEEKMALAHMDIIGELINQKKFPEADQELVKIKELIKNDEALASLLEQYKNKRF